MLTRLSGSSLRLRVGLAVAFLSAGVGYSIADEWNFLNVAAALILGGIAGYFTPSVDAYVHRPNR